jgi:hypothetical protein
MITLTRQYEYNGIIAMDIDYDGYEVTVEIDPTVYHDDDGSPVLYEAAVIVTEYPGDLLKYKALYQVAMDIDDRLEVINLGPRGRDCGWKLSLARHPIT